MAHFVTCDLLNNITGLYTDDPGYAVPPPTAVPLSEADADLLRTGFAGYTLVAGAVQPPLPDYAAHKAAALAAIDSQAGATRLKYITDVAGQSETYLLKADQARAYAAAGYTGTVPGLVQAEIDATGATAQAAADSILAQEATWSAKAAQIESARRCGKVAVGNCANDTALIAAARATAITALAAL